ncbi:solute carrier family 52, riboflavin transporter, member 3-like [Diadema antillarum]|uniref:solute carrier family 52, riboflavin transporter, member 3-like n=1 Tax=Diadema antillarum TaxID=105358 RepID=UPI003A8627DC
MARSGKLRTIFAISLIVFLGIGSWVSVAGIWCELPILILAGIPEQYRINSYVVTVTNLAVVVPLSLLLISKRVSPGSLRVEIPVNHLLGILGTLSSLLLIFFWNRFTEWRSIEQQHSTAFLCLLFVMAAVCTTSESTSLRFASVVKPGYLNWFWIGQGLGSFLPALLVLVQGFGISCTTMQPYTVETTTQIDNITCSNEDCVYSFNFSPACYFSLLLVFVVLSQLSFIFLNTLPCVEHEYNSSLNYRRYHGCTGVVLDESSSPEDRGWQLDLPLGRESRRALLNPSEVLDEEEETGKLRPGPPSFDVTVLYLTQFLISFVSCGVMDTVESYSAAAYGHGTFVVIVPLRAMVAAVSILFFLLRPRNSLRVVYTCLFFGILASAYCMYVASSPVPPLRGTLAGKIVIVNNRLAIGRTVPKLLPSGPSCGCCGVTDTSLTSLIRGGVIGQLGGLGGSLIMFVLINVLGLFHTPQDQGAGCGTLLPDP